MSIPDKDQKILWGRAANRCAFPTCRKELVAEKTASDPAAVLGEMAHIVGEEPTAPRGQSPLTLKERNQYANLILLCAEHHLLVDRQPNTYPVHYLLQLKADHERWVRETLSSEKADLAVEPARSFLGLSCGDAVLGQPRAWSAGFADAQARSHAARRLCSDTASP